MPGRPRQREAAAFHRLDRGARREQGGLVRRRGSDGVQVEPRRRVDGADELDVLARMTALDFLDRRRACLQNAQLGLERLEPQARLRMRSRRVQAGERGVA